MSLGLFFINIAVVGQMERLTSLVQFLLWEIKDIKKLKEVQKIKSQELRAVHEHSSHWTTEENN